MDSQKKTLMISIIVSLGTLTLVLIIVGLLVFFNVTSMQSKRNVEPAKEVSQIVEEAEVPAETQITTMYVANVANSIYLRSRPEEKNDNIITTIPLGAQVVWICDETPIFSKISYGGNTGYVKRDYLSATPPSASTGQSHVAYTNNTRIYKYMYVANVKNSIYLRSSIQETPNNIITTIPLGTRVGFIEYSSNDFSKINYNGTIGYVKTIYLADSYNASYRYMTVCNVKTSIYLRSTPYENPNNIICEIPVNSVVRYLGNSSGGFYQISWDGYTGYAKAIYLK